MLGSPAALRKSSSKASHEARTLLGAGAGTTRTRPPVTPTRVVTSKSDVPPRRLDHAEVLAKLAAVLDEPKSSQSLETEFGMDMGRATTETQHTKVLHSGDQEEEGSRDWAAFYTPITKYPGVITAAHGTDVREDLAALPGGIRELGAPCTGVSSSPLW